MRKVFSFLMIFVVLLLLSCPTPAVPVDPNAWLYDEWIYTTHPSPATVVLEFVDDNEIRTYHYSDPTVINPTASYTLENGIFTYSKGSVPLIRLTEDSFSLNSDIWYRKSNYPLVELDDHILTVNSPAVVTPTIALFDSALYSFSVVGGTEYTIHWQENNGTYTGDIAVSASNQDHSVWYFAMGSASGWKLTPTEDGIVNLYLFFDTAGTVAINVTD